MYYLLTESFKDQHQQLVKIILEAVPADKIYLLGSSLVTERTESIFMPEAPSCRRLGHYFVLVVVQDATHLITVQDKIENTCRNHIPATTLVLQSGTFNEWLAQEHPFARTVKRFTVELNGPDGNDIIPVKITWAEPGDAIAKFTLADGMNKMTEFLAGAELYMLRKQTAMAAFMLHQAVEQGLHTLFHAATGMYLNTHNIDRLVRCCAMVSYKVPAIFPKDNEENKRLLGVLQKAYGDSRYKEGYSVCMKDLALIAEKVRSLKDVMQEMRVNIVKPYLPGIQMNKNLSMRQVK